MTIVSAHCNVAEHIPHLKSSGASAVARFYSPNSAVRLTRHEAAAVSAAGLDIIAAFDGSHRAGNGKDVGWPSLDRGVFDAQIALQQAEGVGQPHGTAIYFRLPAGPVAAQTEYMRGIAEVIGRTYTIGVMGSASACATMRKAALCRLTWIEEGALDRNGNGAAGVALVRRGHFEQQIDGLTADVHDGAGDLGAFRIGRLPSQGRHANIVPSLTATRHAAYFIFAASDAWDALAGDDGIDFARTFSGDDAQNRYAEAIIAKVGAAHPGSRLMVGFDAGDVEPPDPDVDPDYDDASGEPYNRTPRLQRALSLAKRSGAVSIYVEGPGGATGPAWSKDEVLRTLKRAQMLAAENPADQTLDKLRGALAGIDVKKVKKLKAAAFKAFMADAFADQFLPVWRRKPWDGGAWWRVTEQQLRHSLFDGGFEAAEIDNLDSVFNPETTAGRRDLLRFLKDVYGPGHSDGHLPDLLLKNIPVAALDAIKEAIDAQEIPADMFAAFHIFETKRSAVAEQTAVREAAHKFGIETIFSFATDAYRAHGGNAVIAGATGASQAAAALRGASRQFAQAADAALPIDAIINTATLSRLAKFAWQDRGLAPLGYTVGMAVAYAAIYARLKAHDAVADNMARASTQSGSADALVWYDEALTDLGLGKTTPEDRLRRLFVLLVGLGMRESSGRYCEGRDRSAQNTSADTAEAGIFQMSFDLLAGRADLLDVFHRYRDHPTDGHIEIFKRGVTAKPRDLENFGPPSSDGFEFQDLSKRCPMMVVEIAALGLRSVRRHWGPVNRREAQVSIECKELLIAVEQHVDRALAAASPPSHAFIARSPMTRAQASNAELARHFMEPVDLDDLLPINKGLSSAREESMVSLLGSPSMPLTTSCQSERASPLVKRHLVTERMSANFRLTGLRPAIADIKAVLAEAFAAEPGLERVLSTEGMLCVRLRKPTSGVPSTHISNHAWGSAVDFKIVGFDAPGNTAHSIPRFIALLIPLFNTAGWYSGVAFRDSMHFEVSEERIRQWSNDHVLD